MKPCIRCGESKPLSAYYTHPMMGDGHLNKCKVCCREQARLRHYRKSLDPEWVESERERGREKHRRYQYGRNREVPREMEQAEQVAARALPRIPDGMERHHWSYKEEHWRDVILLKIGAHRALHHRMEYDPEMRLFRTPNGHLLDTKKKHVRWLLAVLNERGHYQRQAEAA